MKREKMKLLKVGEKISGYEVVDSAEIKDIDSIYIKLRHLKTGASHIHISNNDSDNTFGVAFKTVPSDSTGVAHILEHTALCGSEKFNVRDPFFSMIKRSLNTFMNAFTSSDWTMYPFSSQNEKDYYNLLDVYLDAAFFPNLTELSFKQEGHRLDFDGDELVFKGVVFNEMKGAMSSPNQIMGRALLNGILPETTYANNSGGSPEIIPDLTHQGLIEFHKRHYHPSNSFFYTYGDLNLEKHLKVIEEKVLCRFDMIDPGTTVEQQKRWDLPKEAVYTFPVGQNEDVAKKCQICIAWLTADVKDSFEILVLSLLGQILLGNAASPLRKALIEPQIGSALCDVTGFDADTRDSLFACGLKDVEEEKASEIERIVFDVLNTLYEKGIDKKLINSALHQIEFHRKEITNTPYPYGIKILLGIGGVWFHGGDPLNILMLDKDLERLNKEIEKGPFLEGKINEYLLENKHRLLLKLVPDKEKAKKEFDAEIKKLKSIKETLSEDDIIKIKNDAKQLEQLQDMEEDISSLPSLELSDISKGVKITERVEELSDENISSYVQPTSGIMYTLFSSGISMLSDEELLMIPLFCTAITKVGTINYDYTELTQMIDEFTGGVGASYQARTKFDEKSDCLAYISLSGKCLNRNRDKMFEILEEIVKNISFKDSSRLRNVLFEFKAGLEASVLQGGHAFAINLSSKNFTSGAYLTEKFSGITQLKFIKKLSEKAGEDEFIKKLASDLSKIAEKVFNSNNFRFCLVGEEDEVKNSKDNIFKIQKSLNSDGKKGFGGVNINLPEKMPMEGWYTSSAVSFVAESFKAVRMTHPDAPVLSVISRILRLQFLHKEIREKGGAYGGMAIFNGEEGIFSLASYRDPHIINTLNVYRQAGKFLTEGRITDDDVKEAILQVCATIDKPETPATSAKKAFVRSLVSLSDEERKKYKEELLKVDLKKIREISEKYFSYDSSQKGVGIISGEEKLRESNEKLEGILTLSAI